MVGGACVGGMHVMGGMRGRGHYYSWGHAWQGCMCGRGACVVGSVHDGGHAWQGACIARGCVWWGSVCGH